jgi:serine/threonine protein kinase
LVDASLTLKICDFGLARILPLLGEGSLDHASMTGGVGSPSYMAPELMRGSTEEELVRDGGCVGGSYSPPVGGSYSPPPTLPSPRANYSVHGTTAIDVWSFGVLAIVVRLRRRPYGTLSALDIIDGVRHHGLRPVMGNGPDDEASFPPNSVLRQLVSDCLLEEPVARPTFKAILATLLCCTQGEGAQVAHRGGGRNIAQSR